MEHLGIQTRDKDIATIDLVKDAKKMTRTSASNGVKLFLVGAQTQDANGAQTNTIAGCYIGTDGYLYSNSNKVATVNQLTDGSVTKIGTSTVGSSSKPIYLNAGVPTAVTSVGEAFLSWGGASINGGISPIDAACIDEFGHNKLAFLPAGCIDVEYTTDGGTTWLDYELSDTNKVAMVTTSGSGVQIGKGTASATAGTLTNANCGNYKARITICSRDKNGTQRVYTQAKKLVLNYSSTGAGGGKVLVEYQTIGEYNSSPTTWHTFGTYDVSGWSGWNSIPLAITLGGSATQTSQYASIRLTLSISSVNTSYSSIAQIIDIRLIGITNWSYPSEMARAGHLYTFDVSQNATFPANLSAANVYPKSNNSGSLGTSSLKWANAYATTFHGALDGNAATATTATKATQDGSGNDIVNTYARLDSTMRRKSITNVGTDYTSFVILLCPLTNTQVSANFYCYGSIYLKRDNILNNIMQRIDLIVGKNYNSTNPIFGGVVASECPYKPKLVKCTYGGTTYAALYFEVNGASFTGTNYFEGAASDFDSIRSVQVYNTHTETVLNSEIYNSIQIITTSTLAPTFYGSPKVSTDGGQTWKNIYHSGNFIAGTDYQAPITSTNKLAASLISGLATVATTGSYSDLSNKPTALKNPYSLTFGSKTYDGSAAKEIVKSDLGLGNVENKSSADIIDDITEADIYALLSAARKAAIDSGVSQEGLATIDATLTTINSAITTLQGRATAMEEALEARDWFAYDENNNMIYIKPGTGAAGSPHDRGLFAYGAVSAGGVGTIGGGGGGTGGDIPHVFLTQAEYDALAIKDPGTLYFTYEE